MQEMSQALLMSQVEYARHRGVTKQAIGKMVKSGKIALDANGKVDAAAADRHLGEVRERVVAREGAGPLFPSPAAGYTPPAEGGLTKAKTATEIYRARLAQLDYEEKVGKLRQVDDVIRSMQLAGDVLAREIEMLPNAAQELAAALHSGGEAALRLALKKLARSLARTMIDNLKLLNAAAPDAAETAAPGGAPPAS